MKHLRRFNESLNKEELQDFCDTYLAYLLDEDFSIEYLGRKSHAMNYKEVPFTKRKPCVNKDLDDSEIISLKKGYRTDNMVIGDPSLMFSWDEIKDHFIPFIHMLSKQYTITNCKLWNLNRKFNMDKDDRFFIDYDYNLSQILEDKVSLEELTQINIYFK
jgi:hypothetical protein